MPDKAAQEQMRKTECLQPDQAGLERAAALLHAGELVAFPTETVYGLGANALDGEAVARIFEAKGRPQFNPLITHVPSLEVARAYAVVHPLAEKLADAFWPGPFTLVLPRREDCGISELVSAGLPTLALRVPSHPVARALLSTAGLPLAAPSANRSGHVSPTEASHVLADLEGRIAAVIDGGAATVGLESTVVGFDGETPVLMRHGGITREAIEAVTGPIALYSDPDRPHSPGQLLSHYAPKAKLRLGIEAPEADEAYLAFGPNERADEKTFLNLSPRGDLAEAAAHLFSYLRQLDDTECDRIAVAPIPDTGLGAAINDRLKRAAEPR